MPNLRAQPYEIVVPPMPPLLAQLFQSFGSFSWACQTGKSLEPENIVARFGFKWSREALRGMSETTGSPVLSGAVICPMGGVIQELGHPFSRNLFFSFQPTITEEMEYDLGRESERAISYYSRLAAPKRIYKYATDTAYLLIKYHQKNSGPSIDLVCREVDDLKVTILAR